MIGPSSRSGALLRNLFQSLKPAVVVVTHIRDVLIDALGNLGELQPFKKEQLQSQLLPVGQLIKCRAELLSS